MLEFGVDFGSYTPNVTKERIQRLRDQYGLVWASIGLQGNIYLDQQIDACLTGGASVDTYLIPRSWYMDPVPLVQARLDHIKQYQNQISEYVWFDVEALPDEEPGPDIVLPWTRTAMQMISRAGWQDCIYTSKSMWSALTGDSDEFQHKPVWEANYGKYRPFTPFAGWAKRCGIQWEGSATLCELNVDLNTWENKEQTELDEQVKALFTEVLAQEGRLGAKVDAVRQEVLTQGILLATGRDKDAEDRIRFEATALGVTLP